MMLLGADRSNLTQPCRAWPQQAEAGAGDRVHRQPQARQQRTRSRVHPGNPIKSKRRRVQHRSKAHPGNGAEDKTGESCHTPSVGPPRRRGAHSPSRRQEQKQGWRAAPTGQARPKPPALGLNELLGPGQGCGQRLQVGLLRAVTAWWCLTPDLHRG